MSPAEIIDKSRYIVVATVDEKRQPWNTPVACFRFEGKLDFYWASWTQNQHSKNIRANKKVFIIAYPSNRDEEGPSRAVYIQADAFELSDPNEVMSAAKVFGDDKYNPSDGNEYLGDKPRRIYKAVPEKAWVNDDKKGPNGEFIHDIRVEISLDSLKTSVK